MGGGAETDLDRRQRRTRAALHAALERLVARMPYADIGISLLAQEADIGRPTFYRHFADVNALLIDRLADDLAGQRALAERLMAQDGEARTTIRAITVFAFDRIAERPLLYHALLDGSAGANASTLFRHQMAALMKVIPYPDDDVRRRNAALTAAMLSGAISGFLLQWIEGEMDPAPADAAKLLIALVLPAIEV